MSNTTAERIRAILSAEKFTPWEAACFFAGDYFGRIPARYPYTESATATLRAGTQWSGLLRIAISTISDALHVAGEGPYTQVGAVLCADERHKYLGQFKATDFCFYLAPTCDNPCEAAFYGARFNVDEYGQLFALARAFKGREFISVSGLSTTSPVFNPEALAGLATAPEESVKALAEHIERDLFEEFWRTYPESPESFSASEIAERERQKRKGLLFATWPPAPIEPERFPTLIALSSPANAAPQPATVPNKEQSGESIPLDTELAPGVTVRELAAMLNPDTDDFSRLLAFVIELKADLMRTHVRQNRGVKSEIEARAKALFGRRSRPTFKDDALSGRQIAHIAAVLNWNPSGGAPTSKSN